MKIGMLGGTFNPIHMGHLVLAEECWHRFELDKVVFIPAHIPPHKEVECSVSAADRLNMTRLALEGYERFEVSTYEIDKKDISYSIETIKHFKEKYAPGAELFFLTGSDWAGDLSTWKNIDEILDSVTFVIASRPGGNVEKSAYEGKITRITIPALDISSSDIRDRIKRREPIDHLVPAPVVQYIGNKGLYR
ncbi:MAG: nicotinate-nucleotide adenylyltransferase [Candidatus Omnitrophota bacterium]